MLPLLQISSETRARRLHAAIAQSTERSKHVLMRAARYAQHWRHIAVRNRQAHTFARIINVRSSSSSSVRVAPALSDAHSNIHEKAPHPQPPPTPSALIEHWQTSSSSALLARAPPRLPQFLHLSSVENADIPAIQPRNVLNLVSTSSTASSHQIVNTAPALPTMPTRRNPLKEDVQSSTDKEAMLSAMSAALEEHRSLVQQRDALRSLKGNDSGLMVVMMMMMMMVVDDNGGNCIFAELKLLEARIELQKPHIAQINAKISELLAEG